ncbi:MAG TPA: peptidyl-prolyl cis-trans isomerase [Vicinamibacterales bacterium]|nr:peptidyl-prolyl cis-trans isomerase [Vicinamibacterales bacterium]
MTMLDRMRRHKGWLKWSLAIVVIAFIWLYIPSFMDNPAGAGNQDVVATVDGREITVGRFRRVYQQQMLAYRNAYGANMDERLLRQLGIEQRVVQQMIEEEMALAEARRLGIHASDAEVRARILALPAFQENGQFIGDQRYRQILNNLTPPTRPDEFEEQVRRSIVVEKLQAALTHWLTVNDAAVDAEFRRRNEKVQVVLVSFPADRFRDAVSVSDAEIAAHFEQHKDTYTIPEKRKVRYALIDLQAIRQRTAVSPQDVERHYKDNQDQYSTPEQVRASHILLETEGKDEAAVRKRAEELLAKARGGADFAKLAAENTDEEAGKTRGGDLDFFGRGAMVKEFEDAAFAMKPGEISDIVRTQFGLHIIKVTDRRPASARTLDEVRTQIEEQLKFDRAENELQRITDRVASRIKTPADLDTVGKPEGLTINESGLFARDEPITGLGMAPAVADRAFAMKEGEVSEPIRTPQGTAFITVTGVEAARVPTLEEVKARVRDDLVRQKAVEAARQKAASVRAELGPSGDLAAAAKKAGLEARTSDLIARGQAYPEVGVSPAVDAAAFNLDASAVSDPIVTDTGAALIRVVEKRGVSPEELASGKGTLKTELLNEQRNRFYAAYMGKVRERLNDAQRISINTQTIAQLIG